MFIDNRLVAKHFNNAPVIVLYYYSMVICYNKNNKTVYVQFITIIVVN